MRLGTNLFQGLKILIEKEIDRNVGSFMDCFTDLLEKFGKKKRLDNGKILATWMMKIVRSHKQGVV